MSNQKPQSIRDVYFQYVSFLHLDWFTFEQLFGEREAVRTIEQTNWQILWATSGCV